MIFLPDNGDFLPHQRYHIKSHQPFQSVYAALTENKDIESRSELVETERERLMVRNTDTGKKILEDIKGLKMLLQAYREGTME